jgi:thioglycine synthase
MGSPGPLAEELACDPLRGRSVAEIDRVLTAAAARFGVARVGEITRLDVLGLPTVTAIRRDPIGESVSVSSGKGGTAVSARVSALAEALERYCAEPRGRLPITTARRDELDGLTLDPESLILAHAFDRATCLEWCRGERFDGTPIWIPANAVMFPYLPAAGAARLFAAHTHGLAVGATAAEAVVHGLLECIERDAYARAVALASVGRGAEVPVIADRAARAVVPARLAILERAGVRYLLRDLTSDVTVPTVLCSISDGALVHLGIAAHPCAALALRAAIDEAAQSRLTDLQGAREDLPDRDAAPAVDPWFLTAGDAPIVNLRASCPAGTIEEVRGWLAERLAAGAPSVVPAWVDLGLAGVDLAVVRVIAPGLEVWAHDPSRIGERAQAWLTTR